MALPRGFNLEVSVDSDLWRPQFSQYKKLINDCCEIVCQNVDEGNALDKFSHIELSVVLCGNALIHELNKDFREQDKATNVLSFCGLEQEEIDAYLRGTINVPQRPFSLGESYIAFETMNKEAAAAGVDFQAHFCHLILHGMLHLLGYDHIDEDEAQVMETLESKLLAILGIDDPYAA